MDIVGTTPPGRRRLQVQQRGGIWSVLKDRVFYGDYLTRAQAIRSACSAACAIDSLGGSAEVHVGGKVVPHQNVDLRP
jgi:hypothetical protein